MSPVCFVTERLFPLQSIDDGAIELGWRAGDLSRRGISATILWIVLSKISGPQLEKARSYYAARNVDLVVLEDLAPFLEDDEKPHRSSGGLAGLLLLPALRKLHEQRRFGRIEIPAERGLAFRVIQAQRAEGAFAGVQIAVVLGNFGEWKRHQQQRLALRAEEIKQDFMERESAELADLVITSNPKVVPFVEELGWNVERIDVRTVCGPPAAERSVIGPRSTPCYIGAPEDDPGFESFRAVIEGTTVPLNVLYAEEPGSGGAALKRRAALEAAAKNSRSQVGFLCPPDWENLSELLRAKDAFAILDAGFTGARLHWLVNESIPFVFPENLLPSLPDSQRQKFARLSYSSHDPRSLFRAMQHARGFEDWPGLHTLWRESLRTAEGAPAAEYAPPEQASAPDPQPARVPRVTIAVSHYNLKQLLHETLECLEAQTYPACDVVVVDDGSDDPESIQAWRDCKKRFPAFSFLELPHRGYWSPRNYAIDQCLNPFIIIVDGDNLPRPEMADVFVRAMLRNPTIAAFTSYIAAFSEDRQAALRGEFQAMNAPLGGDIVSGHFQNIFGDTNSIFQTKALQAAGGFRENFRCAFGDWELFYRFVGKGYRLGVVPRVLLHYRRRAGGMIRQRSLYREHWEFFHALGLPADLRPADRRRLVHALHGLALNR